MAPLIATDIVLQTSDVRNVVETSCNYAALTPSVEDWNRDDPQFIPLSRPTPPRAHRANPVPHLHAVSSEMTGHEWEAQWIEPVPEAESDQRPQRLRRVVELGSDVIEARLRIAARGDFAVFVNDERLDGEGPNIEPDAAGCAVVHHFDATPFLHAGANVLAVILGSAWGTETPVPGSPQRINRDTPLGVLLQLDVTNQLGVTTHIGSDDGFRAVTGAIIYSHPGKGERQEHGLRDAGWKLAEFDDSLWNPVRASADQSTRHLIQSELRPIHLVETLPAVSVSSTADGATLVDFGRRVVGRVRLRFTSPRATFVAIDYLPVLPATEVDPDGTISRDEFVAAGDIDEVFEPGFSVHDFRYLRVRGLPDLEPDQFAALVLSIEPGQ